MHKIFFYKKFIIRLYMFRALCAHHQEVKVVLHSIWYHHTCRWPSHAQVRADFALNLCTGWPPNSYTEFITKTVSVFYILIYILNRTF